MLLIYLSDAVEYLRHTVPRLGLKSQGTQKQACLVVTEQTLVQDVPSQLEIVLMTAQPVSGVMKSSVTRRTHTSTWWGETRDSQKKRHVIHKISDAEVKHECVPGAGGDFRQFSVMVKKEKFIIWKREEILSNHKRQHLTQCANYSSISQSEIFSYRLYMFSYKTIIKKII